MCAVVLYCNIIFIIKIVDLRTSVLRGAHIGGAVVSEEDQDIGTVLLFNRVCSSSHFVFQNVVTIWPPCCAASREAGYFAGCRSGVMTALVELFRYECVRYYVHTSLGLFLCLRA